MNPPSNPMNSVSHTSSLYSKKKDRTGIFYRMSDGFLPASITKILYRPIFKTALIEINGWSLIHFSTGAASRGLGLPLMSYVIIHCIFEIFQLWIEENVLDAAEAMDISLDILFGVLGFVATDKAISLWNSNV